MKFQISAYGRRRDRSTRKAIGKLTLVAETEGEAERLAKMWHEGMEIAVSKLNTRSWDGTRRRRLRMKSDFWCRNREGIKWA